MLSFKEASILLKKISPLLSPDILKVIAEMGHQDSIVLGDANFPAQRYAKHGAIVLRADGVGATELLDAILQLFPLDEYKEQPVLLMEVPADQQVKTPIWKAYKDVVAKYDDRGADAVATLERSAYYEACKDVYAFIQTGETALYANVMLTKGIV